MEEEIEVLQSIFDHDILITPYDGDGKDRRDGDVTIVYKIEGIATMTFTLPSGYPDIPHYAKLEIVFQTLRPNQQKSIREELNATLCELQEGGNVVVYEGIDRLKDLCNKCMEDKGNTNNDYYEDDITAEHAITDHIFEFNTFHANKATEINTINQVDEVEVIHGPITIENLSQFQAHLAKVSSMEQVSTFKKTVLSDKKCARATHNIFAYRFTCPHTGVVHHDCDDDGETAAASRMAEMIRLMDLRYANLPSQGEPAGIAVIVTRWYGGVKLGPDRFKFINNSARHLIEACGEYTGNFSNQTSSSKKQNKTQKRH
jgi:putative IMPACT (imprinted ancient) family translation regulator